MNCLLCNNTVDFKLNIKWILSLKKYKRDNVCKRCREELRKCKIATLVKDVGENKKSCYYVTTALSGKIITKSY